MPREVIENISLPNDGVEGLVHVEYSLQLNLEDQQYQSLVDENKYVDVMLSSCSADVWCLKREQNESDHALICKSDTKL